LKKKVILIGASRQCTAGSNRGDREREKVGTTRYEETSLPCPFSIPTEQALNEIGEWGALTSKNKKEQGHRSKLSRNGKNSGTL